MTYYVYMNGTRQRTPDKKEVAKPAAKLVGRCLTDKPHGNGSYSLGKYLGYLSALREYCRSWDNPRAERSVMPEEPSRGGVLDAIERCDKTDSEVMRQLIKIGERSEDREIAAAARKAILMQLGQAFTGLRPPA